MRRSGPPPPPLPPSSSNPLAKTLPSPLCLPAAVMVSPIGVLGAGARRCVFSFQSSIHVFSNCMRVHLRVGAPPNDLVRARLYRRAAPWWSTYSKIVFSELKPTKPTLRACLDSFKILKRFPITSNLVAHT